METHCARLVQSLTMISLDREAAADAAQEAFIQLYLRWDRVDEYRDPVAWLYRVGINRCKDYHRFLSRTARVVERLGSQSQGAHGDPETGGDELVEWTPDLDFVSTFRSLPKRQRTAATLYYLNDLSVGEIARIMNISEGAVNSHLHRAREALRGLVEAG
jgi:RNA polymerase sigma factor (sigma-70 family)